MGAILFILATLISLVADLWTKHLAFEHFTKVSTSVEWIPGFLYISEARNTGMAFGMFRDYPHVLVVLIGIMSVGIPVYTYLNRSEGRPFLFFIGFVYGGALGNFYDRLTLGFVRDLIDVRFGGFHYPVFNVADSFICVGVALMLLHAWWKSKQA